MRAHKHKERSTYASSIKTLASSTQARTSLYFSKYSVFMCVCFFLLLLFFVFCAQFISRFYLIFVITFRYFVSWFWAFSFDSEIPNSKNAVTNLNCVCILIIQSTPRCEIDWFWFNFAMLNRLSCLLKASTSGNPSSCENNVMTRDR